MGDVYMVNGKILSGLPNHAKDIEFDNTGTDLISTNSEDAIKEVNSNLSQKQNALVTGQFEIAVTANTPKSVTASSISSGTVPSNFINTIYQVVWCSNDTNHVTTVYTDGNGACYILSNKSQTYSVNWYTVS